MMRQPLTIYDFSIFNYDNWNSQIVNMDMG